MEIESEITQTQNDEQNLVERVKNLIQHKTDLNLDDYIKVEQLFELDKDLLQLCDCLRSNIEQTERHQITKIWQKHLKVLQPMFAQGIDSIVALSKNKKVRINTLERMITTVHKLTNGLHTVPAMILITQCAELWSIRELIEQAMSKVTDQEIRACFEVIDGNIVKLRAIAQDLDALICDFQQVNDEAVENELLNLINEKLKMAEQYKDTLQLIVALREKINKHQGILRQCSAHLRNIGFNSIAAGTLALLLLCVNAIPLVGTIAGAAAGVTLGGAALVANKKIRKKVKKYEQRVHRLKEYECELNETLEQIEQLRERQSEIVLCKIEAKLRSRKSFRRRAVGAIQRAFERPFRRNQQINEEAKES